jgi:hypothetical protein
MKTRIEKAGHLVLGVHPTTYGFGWILFEAPNEPLDWGMASAKDKRGKRLFARFDRIVSRYEPDVLVLETFDDDESRRSKGAHGLCREMAHRARVLGLDVRVYDREIVRSNFTDERASTRVEIATVIAARIPALSHRQPYHRGRYRSQDARQSIFDAAALALTYYALMGKD